MVKQLANDAIDITPENVSELEDDYDNDLSSIFASFGGAPDDKAYEIRIYRVIKDTAERSWLFNAVPSELPIEARLRDQYKGGRFEIRIYENRGGRLVLRRKPTIVIEPPPQTDVPQTSDLALLVKALQDNQTQMFTQLSEIMKKSQGVVDVPANPFEMMKSMAAAMVSMREMMQPATLQPSPLEMFETAFTLAEKIKGGGDKETNMLDLVRDFLKPEILGPVFSSLTMKNVTPQPGAIPAQPQAQSNPQQEAPAMNPVVTQYISFLVQKAKGGADPELYAEMILDNVDPDTAKAQFTAPDTVDKLIQINPEVANYRQWFVDLHAALVRFLSETPAA